MIANGVKVVVDEVSIDYLRGATIDFVNDPVRGAGFAVDSPMAQSHSHEHGEDARAPVAARAPAITDLRVVQTKKTDRSVFFV